ncbi:MAG: ferritin family protein [Elusimicrobiota bacterium]
MDIIDFAIGIETEGEKMYRDLADKAEDTGMKNILGYLADAELQHKQVFKNMNSGGNAVLENDNVIEEAKIIFQEMGKRPTEVSMENYEVSIYRDALSAEQKSIDYYEKHSDKFEGSQKQNVLDIIEEEKKHYRLIENIIEFINRPQTWLENAEWNHLDNY